MPFKIRSLSLAAGLVLFARPDVPDARFREFAATGELSSLVRIIPLNAKGSGSGVLLANGVVLTAAHVVARIATESLIVLVGDQRFTVREIIVHPNWNSTPRVDLAIVRLRGVPERRPAVLAARAPSLPTQVVIAGYGIGGATRRNSAGTARAGENILDERGGLRPEAIDSSLLVGDFDLPGAQEKNATGSATPMPLEVLPSGGDSGGPLFVKSPAGFRLLAIYSHSGYRLDQWVENQPTYAGSRFAATDLTRHFHWLSQHGIAIPSPDPESP